ncbi:MAG: 7-cyano-7-deazaguanine synthase QueC [Nitrospinota bacterium]|nr:7-cyano-7-deazaguanine synthase QueC [Nitrospinota bacterium]MDP7554914.1 7-cyano-7-deazaguanine synthase QueC [Nitrospinota bacterium]MDP7580753.1 7-cyano-7-deazaguanine synthase QueC [Nitrospinota bacterium]HJN01997.1 7-cyano-7-deazaguanine synthase QueC [Nitrospinota bacterium]
MGLKAVVLLSGGIDSATTLAIAKNEGYNTYAISFNYGQRHSFELEKAAKIAGLFKSEKHLVVNIDLRKFGGSALTDSIPVPKDRNEKDISHGIPSTYVPARNTIFLSLSLGWAEIIEAEDIFIGVNAIDYSGYPDCRPEYIEAFQQMASIATKAGVERKSKIKIHTPLINMSKAEIIKKGVSLGMDFSLTHSCYDPISSGKPCGRCDSCLLRLKGFLDAGLKDPLEYS